ncbi:MAG: type II toxin-antitoxin system prevent-host-death family antitoxin [Acidobacterium sp.]|nr:type II toxin-antitoxin system prevent-host-death family antitoxin [Acidobacteriota bacterium]PHY09792.1 MAG: type II toxin-antitoxin system prevent-host-death family antitoxin [Acidobacterium sp.]
MNTSISAATANRDFSTLLRKVRGGATFVVTSHGRPVARLVPVAAGAMLAGTAKKTLFQRLAAAPVLDAGRWTRDELYEDER